MDSLYVWLKFFHLLGLGVFLFGHGISAGASLVVRSRPVDAVTGALLGVSVRANAIAYPGLLVLLVTGVWMGFAGSWWHAGWIWVAIGVLVATLVVMGALSVPYHRTRDALAKKESGGDVENRLKQARPAALAAVGTLALVILFFLMVFKPF